MKRLALITAIVLCSAHGAETVAQLRDNALAIAAAPYIRLHQEYILIHHELVLNLEQAKDKESADKVATSVNTLTKRLQQLHEQENKLPVPHAYIQTQIQKHKYDYKKLSLQGVGKALAMVYEQEPPCYGSIMLEKALEELLREFCIAI